MKLRKLTCALLGVGLYVVAVSASAKQVYLWADQPSAASYQPDLQYTGTVGSSSAFAPRVTRSGSGVYQVDLDHALLNVSGGNVQIAAAEGGGKYCKVKGWQNSKVDVRCFLRGTAADSRFSMIATDTDSGAAGLAWAWVNAGAATLVAPAYARAPSGTPNASNPSIGVYVVNLPGATTAGGNVQVTAYGTNSDYCEVASWNQAGVTIHCFDKTGTRSNTSFSLLKTDDLYAPSQGRYHFTWANNQSGAEYAPTAAYTRAPDAEVRIRRRSQGQYEVKFGTLVTGGGAAIATSYDSNAHCNATGWGGNGVVVECVTPNGSPTDSRFSLLALRSGQSNDALIAASDVRREIALPTATAATLRQSINVAEQLCINTQCETAWDKTASEREYDGTTESVYKPHIDSATLRYLCPERRKTTDREFGGNGPDIRAFTTINQSAEALELTAFMKADETGGGTSTAAKTWRGTLYTPPEGWRITNVSATHSETSYRDHNHEEDTPPVSGGSLVSEFRFKGDTGGDDIGNCTKDDTYMTIAYNPVTVTLASTRTGLRSVAIASDVWTTMLRAKFRMVEIRLNNYDRTKSQPERRRPEDRYYVDWSGVMNLGSLSAEEVNMGSYFSYDGGPRQPLVLPSIQRSTFIFLINNIVSPGTRNTVSPAGGHIRLAILFEETDPEIVAACIDNIACGSGEPHEFGKPLLQVDGMKIIPYMRPMVEREGTTVKIHAEITRIRLEADFARDGMCRDNTFAGLCQAFAGDIEKIAYDAVLERLDRFIASSRSLTGLLDDQLTAGICQYIESIGEACSALRDIVLNENGDMLLWFDS